MVSQQVQPPAKKGGQIVAAGMVALVLICGSWGGAYFGILRERFKAQQIATARLAERQEVLNRLETSLKNRAQFDRDMSDLQKQIANAATRVPTTRDISALLDEVTQLAEQFGLNLQNFQEGKGLARAGLLRVPLKVLLSGDYRSLLRFVDALENTTRVLDVGDLHVTPFSDDDNRTTLSIELTLVAYQAAEEAMK